MKWASPSALLLLLIPVALSLFALFQHRRGFATLFQAFSPVLFERLIPQLNLSARKHKLFFWLGGMLLLVAALARPQWGAREEVIGATGLDLMVVLDLSRSMDVEDVVPSRIKKARHFISRLLEPLAGDRVGVVAFAASTYVACPLTNDLNYVQEVLEVLNPGSLGNQGTDIGLGLETALASLERGAQNTDPSASVKGAPTRAILLVTDGEDHEGEAARIASKLKEKGIQLFVLGVGSQRGGPIPLRDEQGQLMGYKRQGREVVQSRLEPKTLEAVAQASGGRYWTVSDSESEREELLGALGALDRTQLAERKVVIPTERFQLFVGIGLILLLVEWWIPLVRLWVVILFLFGGVNAQASTLKSYLKNRQGVAAFDEKDIELARKNFSEAQASDPEKVEPTFNQGVAELQSGATEKAVKSFDEATQRAKQQGNPQLSGVSLYNLGAAHEKARQHGQAIRAFAESIRMARLAGDPELEVQARKRIEALQQQKQEQDQQQKQQQQRQEQQQQGSQSQPEPKSQGQSYEDPSVSRKRAFRSEKLSPEDSERVMAEISAREKQLQARLKKQRGNANSQSGRDW